MGRHNLPPMAARNQYLVMAQDPVVVALSRVRAAVASREKTQKCSLSGEMKREEDLRSYLHSRNQTWVWFEQVSISRERKDDEVRVPSAVELVVGMKERSVMLAHPLPCYRKRARYRQLGQGIS
jgi:hypothetical protein